MIGRNKFGWAATSRGGILDWRDSLAVGDDGDTPVGRRLGV